MINKGSFLLITIVLVAVIANSYCNAEPMKEENERNTEMIGGNNKDVIIRVEPVKINTGATAGFHIEVINPITDKNIVLVVRDDISLLFAVRLINERGLDISPMMQKIMLINTKGPTSPKYRYNIILPHTSHAWFIPVPSQVRIDPTKLINENNLQPIPKGKYMAEIQVDVEYFTQDKRESLIPEPPDFKHPNFQTLKLTLPCIPIIIDSTSPNQDIIKIYTENERKD